MARATSHTVKAIMAPGGDYDLANNPDLTLFIRMAASVVRRMVACATRRGYTHSEEDKELIEINLSAHFYQMSDQAFASKSTAGASATFQGQTGLNLSGTKYGQGAMDLDGSNCLRSLGKSAGVTWLGKTESEALDWDMRN